MPNDLPPAVLAQHAHPYSYTDGQNHRLILRTATDEAGRPYVWVEADNLARGGHVVSVWLTLEQTADLGTTLGSNRLTEYQATDHTGDTLAVVTGATWTTFEVTRKAGDDGETAAVRVVVLTARLPELRTALTVVAEYAQQRISGPVQPPRVLTPGEHDRAWHAVEGAAGEPGADPGTILSAVLAALNIQPPSAEDEQAASAALRDRLASRTHRGR